MLGLLSRLGALPWGELERARNPHTTRRKPDRTLVPGGNRGKVAWSSDFSPDPMRYLTASSLFLALTACFASGLGAQGKTLYLDDFGSFPGSNWVPLPLPNWDRMQPWGQKIIGVPQVARATSFQFRNALELKSTIRSADTGRGFTTSRSYTMVDGHLEVDFFLAGGIDGLLSLYLVDPEFLGIL